MGNRIARYKSYYEDGIFDDEKPVHKPYEFSVPLKVDDVGLLKKMEMIHTLLTMWHVKPSEFCVYLQRDLFKGYKQEDSPDEGTYDEAIRKLTQIRQMNSEEHGRVIGEDSKEPDASTSNPQNDFEGISPGGISLFEQDVEPSTGGMDSIPGYNFTMCSTKVGLWTLEGRECHLIGIRSPFGRPDYVEYLNTLDDSTVAMLRERMEHYSLPENASLLFGINNTIRVMQACMDNPENPLYYVVYPDGDYEMTTDFNSTFRSDNLKIRIERYVGKKVYTWLKTKFAQLAK